MLRCSLSLFVFIVVLLYFAASSLMAQQNQAVLSTIGELRWTTKPVRVEPSAKSMPITPREGLNGTSPSIVSVPKSVKVLDSITFSVGDKSYRLVNVQPIPPQYVCKDSRGKRWACGLRSRINLRALIAGKQIKCKFPKKPNETLLLVECDSSLGINLARAQLRAGFALPSSKVGSDFSEAVSIAISSRGGIWSDEVFFAANNAKDPTR